MSLATEVAEWLSARQAGGIDAAITRKTQLHILDTAAITIAARERCTIAGQVRAALGSSAALAPPAYAFAASAHGHMLDFDDVHDLARVHPTSVTLPAALAVSSPISTTSDLVQAVALGNEVMCRLGLIWRPGGTGPGSDWFLTQLFGYFGAAVSASTLLGLDVAQTVSALGLAYMQAAGGKEAGAGGTARAIYPAFAAQGGVQAVLLARAGVLGPSSALDGAAGLFPLYFGRHLDAAQRAGLLDPQAWTWSDTQPKPWPCCRHSHPFIFAAQQLRAELAGAEVQRITVAVDRSAAKLCRPLEPRLRPSTLQDAKYSIPFLVAFALVREELSLQTLDETSLQDEAVLAMADRIVIEQTADDPPGLPRASITTQTSHGHSLCFDGAFAPPSGESFLREKFQSCLAFAGWPQEARSRLWQSAQAAEDTEFVTAVRPLLA